ncbi:mitochondrial pyruvate carrier 4-like [Hibiscus syriacus]|uniref:mitochondrial pyruvate carrier 4-like n=1 Tax=Hibiscus syriacus TaxID=106335 RepID=UPI001920EBE3|nr:mitochondrial pyruvate carrier 4-like [Hibiscus syriacus]
MELYPGFFNYTKTEITSQNPNSQNKSRGNYGIIRLECRLHGVLQALWNHPTGPKTIHFWAPTFKWGISIANVADFTKPQEKLSYPQQIAVTCTGVIWSRYSTVITPKNWNLFSVSIVMAGTGLYQLARKVQHNFLSEAKAKPANVNE